MPDCIFRCIPLLVTKPSGTFWLLNEFGDYMRISVAENTLF